MRRPPKSVIYINFLPDHLFLEPTRIWTALKRAEDHGKITPLARGQLHEKYDRTAVHLARRDHILRAAVEALKASLRALMDDIPEPWKIPETELGGIHYRTVRGKHLFEVRDSALFAVDSLLFEFRAYLELLANFVYGILKGTDGAPSSQVTLSSGKRIKILSKKGRLQTHSFLLYLCDCLSVGMDWYQFLSEHRNFFTHVGAPDIAIEDLARPPEYGFIIMRVTIRDFAQADPRDYFRLSEFTEILKGVKKLAVEAQGHLVRLLET